MSQCYVRKLIAEAMKWEGYREKNSKTSIKSKTANAGSGNYTWFTEYIYAKYPKWFTSYKGKQPWCSCYVQYCHLMAFGFEDAIKITYQPAINSLTPACMYAYRYFKKVGRVGKEPRVGASIFFSNNGKEDNIHHTGIVIAYTNDMIRTLEGNTGDSCAYRTYKRNSPIIYGYGYPNFDPDPNGDPTPIEFLNAKVICDNPTTTTNVTIIGANSSPTQSASNTSVTSYTPSNKEISFGSMNILKKEVQAIGRVYNCDSLNVRTLPGAENPQLKSVPSIPNGTVVEVLDKVNAANGKAWYYIKIGGKVHGFVSASYIQLVNASATSSPSAFAPIQDDSGKYSTR